MHAKALSLAVIAAALWVSSAVASPCCPSSCGTPNVPNPAKPGKGCVQIDDNNCAGGNATTADGCVCVFGVCSSKSGTSVHVPDQTSACTATAAAACQ